MTMMNESLQCKTKLWLKHSSLAWVEAEILELLPESKILCSTSELGNVVVESHSESVLLKNIASIEDSDNLKELIYLDEPNVMNSLRLRYMQNKIYTYTGDILIALNPWKNMEEMYNKHRTGNDRNFDRSPHVYAVADRAYREMIRQSKSQSILVSGESGAGKTVTTRYLLKYLTSMDGSSRTEFERQVFESNPILEAFGNAKTVRNDNSSRFGRFILLKYRHFDAKSQICGSSIETYLLEKSRVVRLGEKERNFHIFYQLYAAVQNHPNASAHDHIFQSSHLRLSSANFRILGNSINMPGVCDKDYFDQTISAMKVIGLKNEEISDVMKALASILHLGNAEFSADTTCAGTSNVDKAVLSVEESVHSAANLLQVELSSMRNVLLFRNVKAVDETVAVRNSQRQAESVRDALVKALYGKLFLWLVQRINRVLGSYQATTSNLDCPLQIGILDIFGFESFENNYFEQFCINYANEKLQRQFNLHVLEIEQEEYRQEGIPWTDVPFYDITPCLELIESKASGILDLVDEECRVPRGCDEGFASKVRTIKHPNLIPHRTEAEKFTIVHYAGHVTYSSAGFLERNNDTLNQDIVSFLRSCGLEFVSSLFVSNDSNDKKRKHTFHSREKIIQSLGGQFKRQLSELIALINSTNPHYVRCINPNQAKKPLTFEIQSVIHQLRYGGVLEAVRVIRAGYPTRFSLHDFLYRYAAAFASRRDVDASQQALKILRANKFVEGTDFRIGNTKVFLRENRSDQLEINLATKLHEASIILQSRIRAQNAREHLRRTFSKICLLQANLRMCKRRFSFQTVLNSILKIQRFCRESLERTARIELFDSVILAQSDVSTMTDVKNTPREALRRLTIKEIPSSAERFKIVQDRLSELMAENDLMNFLQDQNAELNAEKSKLTQELVDCQLQNLETQTLLACKLEEAEGSLHAERMKVQEMEGFVENAERGLARIRREKGAVDTELAELKIENQALRKAIVLMQERIDDLSRKALPCFQSPQLPISASPERLDILAGIEALTSVPDLYSNSQVSSFWRQSQDLLALSLGAINTGAMNTNSHTQEISLPAQQVEMATDASVSSTIEKEEEVWTICKEMPRDPASTLGPNAQTSTPVEMQSISRITRRTPVKTTISQRNKIVPLENVIKRKSPLKTDGTNSLGKGASPAARVSARSPPNKSNAVSTSPLGERPVPPQAQTRKSPPARQVPNFAAVGKPKVQHASPINSPIPTTSIKTRPTPKQSVLCEVHGNHMLGNACDAKTEKVKDMRASDLIRKDPKRASWQNQIPTDDKENALAGIPKCEESPPIEISSLPVNFPRYSARPVQSNGALTTRTRKGEIDAKIGSLVISKSLARPTVNPDTRIRARIC